MRQLLNMLGCGIKIIIRFTKKLKLNSSFITFKVFKYFLIGLTGQFIDYSFTVMGHDLFGINIIRLNIFGYLIGSTTTYILHAKYTFADTASNLLSIRQITLFIITCLTGIILGSLYLFFILKTNLALQIAKLTQLILIGFIQFVLNYAITFRKNYFKKKSQY